MESQRLHIQTKRRWSMIAIGFLTAFTVSLGATSAVAGSASSAYGYYSVGGYSYRNQATIVTGTGNDYAYTNLRSTSGNVPPGWFGTLSRGWTTAGALTCSSGYTYNSTWSSGQSRACAFSGYSGSAYYSYGVTKGWNGSSYNAYYTFKSPLQNG